MLTNFLFTVFNSTKIVAKTHQKEGEKMFGVDSVMLPEIPKMTNWMNQQVKYQRRKRSYFNTIHDFGVVKKSGVYLKNNVITTDQLGHDIEMVNTCSYDSLFHLLLISIRESTVLQNCFEESQNEIIQFIINQKENLEILYQHRIKFFRKLLNCPNTQYTINCFYAIEEVYRNLFNDDVMFLEHGICRSCNKKLIVTNIARINCDSLKDCFEKCENFEFRCDVCQEITIKFKKECLMIFPVKNLDFQHVYASNNEMYLKEKLPQIPASIKIFNKNYKITGGLAIENENHYVTFYRDTTSDVWFGIDDRARAKNKIGKNRLISIVSFFVYSDEK